MLFTSQFPDTHGVIGMTAALPTELPTLAEQLRSLGEQRRVLPTCYEEKWAGKNMGVARCFQGEGT